MDLKEIVKNRGVVSQEALSRHILDCGRNVHITNMGFRALLIWDQLKRSNSRRQSAVLRKKRVCIFCQFARTFFRGKKERNLVPVKDLNNYYKILKERTTFKIHKKNYFPLKCILLLELLKQKRNFEFF